MRDTTPPPGTRYRRPCASSCAVLESRSSAYARTRCAPPSPIGFYYAPAARASPPQRATDISDPTALFVHAQRGGGRCMYGVNICNIDHTLTTRARFLCKFARDLSMRLAPCDILPRPKRRIVARRPDAAPAAVPAERSAHRLYLWTRGGVQRDADGTNTHMSVRTSRRALAPSQRHAPPFACHSLRVPSSAHVATMFRCGWMATPIGPLSWAASRFCSFPSCASKL